MQEDASKGAGSWFGITHAHHASNPSLFSAGKGRHFERQLATVADAAEISQELADAPRPRRLLCSLTQALVLSNFGAKAEVCFPYGRLATSNLLSGLSERLSSDVTPIFAISEVPAASAPLCGHCHGYHLGPGVVVEVATPQNGSTTRGVLLLTPLYPLQSLHPLFRYVTNDVVEFVRCDARATPGLRHHGRRWRSVCDESGYILTDLQIHEALDDLPTLFRPTHPLERAFAVGMSLSPPARRVF